MRTDLRDTNAVTLSTGIVQMKVDCVAAINSIGEIISALGVLRVAFGYGERKQDEMTWADKVAQVKRTEITRQIGKIISSLGDLQVALGHPRIQTDKIA